jgi:hypothetical protein
VKVSIHDRTWLTHRADADAPFCRSSWYTSYWLSQPSSPSSTPSHNFGHLRLGLLLVVPDLLGILTLSDSVGMIRVCPCHSLLPNTLDTFHEEDSYLCISAFLQINIVGRQYSRRISYNGHSQIPHCKLGFISNGIHVQWLTRLQYPVEQRRTRMLPPSTATLPVSSAQRALLRPHSPFQPYTTFNT